MKFKGVLFDFDGVVVNSTPMHLAGWERAYETIFGQSIAKEFLETLPGQSTRAIAERLAQLAKAPDSISELIEKKAAYVLENLENIPLIAGIIEFMEFLDTRRIPFGVSSNAPRAFLAAAISKHSLNPRFYLGLEDYEWPKPHPEAYLKGAKCLGWGDEDRSNIAVFEDSVHGIHAALKAGTTPFGISSQHTAEHLNSAGAIKTFPDFLHLGRLKEDFPLNSPNQ